MARKYYIYSGRWARWMCIVITLKKGFNISLLHIICSVIVKKKSSF